MIVIGNNRYDSSAQRECMIENGRIQKSAIDMTDASYPYSFRMINVKHTAAISERRTAGSLTLRMLYPNALMESIARYVYKAFCPPLKFTK